MKETVFFVTIGIMLFSLFAQVFAQERIVITTYYPAPYGVYKNLRSERLAVGWTSTATPTFWDHFITVRTGYGDIIALGGDASSNDLEIRLWAPSFRNTVSFWNARIGTLANIRAANIPSCRRYAYSNTSGILVCPPGYQLAGVDTNSSANSGFILCCQYR